MRRDELPLVVLDGRHTGELLAHPCGCGHQRCTIGEHVWDSTRNMTPGPRAQAFEPRTITPHTPNDADPRPDSTSDAHDQYRRLLADYQQSARRLELFVARHRPDRWTTVHPDDDWCANHLDLIGMCEPRHRGDQCRRCYDFRLAYGSLPDRLLLEAVRRHGAMTPGMLADWRARTRPKSRKRKKAR